MPVYCTDKELDFIYANKDIMSQYAIAKAIGKSATCVFKHYHGEADPNFVRSRNKGNKRHKTEPSKVIKMPNKIFFNEQDFKGIF